MANLLRFKGILPDTATTPITVDAARPLELVAGADRLHREHNVGERVTSAEPIGTIIDPFGKVRAGLLPPKGGPALGSADVRHGACRRNGCVDRLRRQRSDVPGRAPAPPMSKAPDSARHRPAKEDRVPGPRATSSRAPAKASLLGFAQWRRRHQGLWVWRHPGGFWWLRAIAHPEGLPKAGFATGMGVPQRSLTAREG